MKDSGKEARWQAHSNVPSVEAQPGVISRIALSAVNPWLRNVKCAAQVGVTYGTINVVPLVGRRLLDRQVNFGRTVYRHPIKRGCLIAQITKADYTD